MSGFVTEYVQVKADVTKERVVPDSSYDTTTGYYITYSPTVGEGGGITGQGWYTDNAGSPFYNFDTNFPGYTGNSVEGKNCRLLW